MPLTLQIKDNQVKLMIDFYVERHKEIRKQVTELENEAREVTKIIQQLKNKPADDNSAIESPFDEEYSAKWPWIKKIIFALNKLNKPSTTKEIVDVLTDYEPDFISDRKRVVASISSTLSVKSGNPFQNKDFIKKEGISGEFEFYINIRNNNMNDDKDEVSMVEITEPMDDLPF